ncbi:MAG: 4-hydroxybenzoate octaprenyltransferase [Nitrospiraceae bacterium]
MLRPDHRPSTPQATEPAPTPPPESLWFALLRLIRFGNQTGTMLLLLPCWWALWIASRGVPPLSLLLIFAGGAFLMRSAGVIMNDLTDRRIDRHVRRTAHRPLAEGSLRPIQALVLLVLLLMAAVGLLFLLPARVWPLAPTAVVLAAIYPWAKRYVPIPQAILGLAFGWGVIMAWGSVRESIDAPAWLLYLGTASWAIAYDTIYAMQDREDDRAIGVRSSALYFGDRAWLAVLCFQFILLVCVGAAGWLTDAASLLFTGLVFIAYWLLRLLRDVYSLQMTNEPSKLLSAFGQQVLVGLAILGVIILGYW